MFCKDNENYNCLMCKIKILNFFLKMVCVYEWSVPTPYSPWPLANGVTPLPVGSHSSPGVNIINGSHYEDYIHRPVFRK